MIPYEQLAAIRLGYGLSPRRRAPADPGALLSEVAEAALSGEPTIAAANALQDQSRTIRRDIDQGKDGAKDALRAHKAEARALQMRARLERFARAVDAPAGFGERLVWFWADHFTVEIGTVYSELFCASFVEEAIRPHIGGRFVDMMFAAETHPAMLRYLDQSRSYGPNSIMARKKPGRPGGLNENLAREMLELHSLGVGANYSQRDIEELAELLTGLTHDPRRTAVFQPQRAEPGAETVLGVSYGGQGRGRIADIRAVITDLAAHPATAAHLARKMAVHFVADDPPQPLVARLEAAFSDSGGDLSAMNRTLAEAPELQDHLRSKMRQPFEFIVAGLRSLGVQGDRVRAFKNREAQDVLATPMELMGQPWGLPDGPDGWPEAAGIWGSPQGLAARINWAMRQPSRLRRDLPDPREFLHIAIGQSVSEPLAWAVPKAESRVEGVGIVLASADFNRR